MDQVFNSPWQDSDLILVVEKKQFHVHRHVLIAQSPVFKAMLTGDFREFTQTKINLPKKQPRGFLEFLKLLYPTSLVQGGVTMANIESLISLADEYDVQLVIDKCLDFLEGLEIDAANVKTILPLACKYGHRRLRDRCVYFAQEYLQVREVKALADDLDRETLDRIIWRKLSKLEKMIANLAVPFRHSLDENTREKAKRCKMGHNVSFLSIGQSSKCQHCKNELKHCLEDISIEPDTLPPRSQVKKAESDYLYHLLMEIENITNSTKNK